MYRIQIKLILQATSPLGSDSQNATISSSGEYFIAKI